MITFMTSNYTGQTELYPARGWSSYTDEQVRGTGASRIGRTAYKRNGSPMQTSRGRIYGFGNGWLSAETSAVLFGIVSARGYGTRERIKMMCSGTSTCRALSLVTCEQWRGRDTLGTLLCGWRSSRHGRTLVPKTIVMDG